MYPGPGLDVAGALADHLSVLEDARPGGDAIQRKLVPERDLLLDLDGPRCRSRPDEAYLSRGEVHQSNRDAVLRVYDQSLLYHAFTLFLQEPRSAGVGREAPRRVTLGYFINT